MGDFLVVIKCELTLRITGFTWEHIKIHAQKFRRDTREFVKKFDITLTHE